MERFSFELAGALTAAKADGPSKRGPTRVLLAPGVDRVLVRPLQEGRGSIEAVLRGLVVVSVPYGNVWPRAIVPDHPCAPPGLADAVVAASRAVSTFEGPEPGDVVSFIEHGVRYRPYRVFGTLPSGLSARDVASERLPMIVLHDDGRCVGRVSVSHRPRHGLTRYQRPPAVAARRFSASTSTKLRAPEGGPLRIGRPWVFAPFALLTLRDLTTGTAATTRLGFGARRAAAARVEACRFLAGSGTTWRRGTAAFFLRDGFGSGVGTPRADPRGAGTGVLDLSDPLDPLVVPTCGTPAPAATSAASWASMPHTFGRRAATWARSAGDRRDHMFHSSWASGL